VGYQQGQKKSLWTEDDSWTKTNFRSRDWEEFFISYPGPEQTEILPSKKKGEDGWEAIIVGLVKRHGSFPSGREKEEKIWRKATAWTEGGLRPKHGKRIRRRGRKGSLPV